MTDMAEIRPFVLIQDWMYDLNLTASETIAVAIIYGYTQDGEHTCHAAAAYFARYCRITERQVTKLLRRLEEKGIIRVTRRDGRVSEYALRLHGEDPRTKFTPEQSSPPNFCAKTPEQSSPLSPFLSPTPPIYSSIQEKKEKIERPRKRACEAEPRASPSPEGDGGLFGETPRAAAGDGGPGSSVTAQSQVKKSAAKPGRAPFVPPTVGEVREYVALRGSGIDPVAFFSFYENRDWRLSDGRRMKDWRLAVVTWERRDRNGRRY